MAKSRLQKKLEERINLIVNKFMGSGLAQEENTVNGERYITPGIPEQIRKLAEEGIVLLKNENQVLPIKEEKMVSVFGRIQHDWFLVGYGSGGDVHPPYEVSFFEGLEQAGIKYNKELKEIYDKWASQPEHEADHGFWGHWPYYHEEMPLSEDLVKAAREKGDTALIVIGRAAGEDRDNKLEAGSYYLTQTEKDMLQLVCRNFERRILVMDCGNIIDMSFLEDYPMDAVVYAWQLGQENANALANVLSGKINPSGKLSDAIARRYEDYPSARTFGDKEFNTYVEDIYVGYRFFTSFAPERMLYPFGFGLSYTDFSLKLMDAVEENGNLTFRVQVSNVGKMAGKEVVQIYASAPMGKLGKASRSLAGYQKTGLLAPGASEIVEINIQSMDYASFDESGITGHNNCFVLEEGEYTFYVGTDCLANEISYSFTLEETMMLQQCEEVCIPGRDRQFMTLNPVGLKKVKVLEDMDPLPASTIAAGSRDLRQRVLDRLPAEIPQTKDKGIRLSDVKKGKASLEEFIAQLSDRDLANISRGEGFMNSSLGTEGNAGTFGGITKSLRKKGIPAMTTADGPAGLRLRRYTTLLPCGTAIACSWNPALVEETFVKVGEEAKYFKVHVNLAPGMNIHRNPLCGRNFEYYSEDPMLSGRTAAATVRGLQTGGTSACPKHFACNNQEYNRNYNDSRLSMRALREIYLKNFEYCIKEGHPWNVMTSYNKLNGVWCHYNYDLVTTVLRGEWKYEGNIVTDWWMRKDTMPEFPKISVNAYRTRAQVDVFMPGNMMYGQNHFMYDWKHLKSLGKKDGLTRGELQRSAANVLRFILTFYGKK